MPKLTRKTAILAKMETTYGTNSIPTGSANAIIAYDIEITPIEAETVSRDYTRPYLGNSETLIANNHVSVSFGIEITGSGSGNADTPAPYAPLLRGSGLSQTISTAPDKVIFEPISTNFESLSIYCFVDGLHHKITGCRGTVSFELERNKIPMMKFRFIGIYVPVVDAGMPTTDYTDWQKPYVCNDTYTYGFSFFGVDETAIPLEKISFDMGNNLVYRALIGSESAIITDRKVAGSATFEAPTLAILDVFEKSLATTNGLIQITHGGATGKMKFEIPSADLGTPTYGDSDSVRTLTVPFNAIPVSGNDEIIITTF
jgi:hypothetical protein